VENGRLAGLKVAETKTEGRKAEPIPGSEHELRAPASRFFDRLRAGETFRDQHEW